MRIVVITIFGLAVVVAFLLPNLCVPRERAQRIKCGSNLRQIGVSIGRYAAEHGGRYPDQLEELFAYDLTPATLICPSSTETAAIGATTQAVLADLHAGPHCSYIYLGKGLTTATPSTTVVALESVANHNQAGGEVLYADGHVDWCVANDPVFQTKATTATALRGWSAD